MSEHEINDILNNNMMEDKQFLIENWYEKLAKLAKYGVIAVLGNDCRSEYSDLIQGEKVQYIGMNDEVIEGWRFLPVGQTTLRSDPETGISLQDQDRPHRDRQRVVQKEKTRSPADLS